MPDEVDTANDVELAKNTLERLARRNNDRVAQGAVLRVAFEEERRITEVFRLAGLVAQRAGRKTVREEDVMVVYEIMESEIS